MLRTYTLPATIAFRIGGWRFWTLFWSSVVLNLIAGLIPDSFWRNIADKGLDSATTFLLVLFVWSSATTIAIGIYSIFKAGWDWLLRRHQLGAMLSRRELRVIRAIEWAVPFLLLAVYGILLAQIITAPPSHTFFHLWPWS